MRALRLMRARLEHMNDGAVTLLFPFELRSAALVTAAQEDFILYFTYCILV